MPADNLQKIVDEIRADLAKGVGGDFGIRHQHCGMSWRPAVVDTVGVEFLPGFKDEEPKL